MSARRRCGGRAQRSTALRDSSPSGLTSSSTASSAAIPIRHGAMRSTSQVIRGAPRLNEAVLFHRPSGTMSCADFVFNITKPPNIPTRILLAITGAGGPRAPAEPRLALRREGSRRDARVGRSHPRVADLPRPARPRRGDRDRRCDARAQARSRRTAIFRCRSGRRCPREPSRRSIRCYVSRRVMTRRGDAVKPARW